MEIIYDNGSFQVIANPLEPCYYVLNVKTGVRESKEESEATAKFKADAAKSVLIKHNIKRGEEDARQ